VLGADKGGDLIEDGVLHLIVLVFGVVGVVVGLGG
jgi:hypothetical protein